MRTPACKFRDSVHCRRRAAACAVAILCAAPGCSDASKKTRDARWVCPPMTFAVAPILNFSGDFVFEPDTAADLLASELTDFPNATVLPVNRVIAYLAGENKQCVESPEHAVEVAEAVGADAIVVGAVTEYDAYTPVVGLVLQLYVVPPEGAGRLSPSQAAREASPSVVQTLARAQEPSGQFQRVYNAQHKQVIKAVKLYADSRAEQATNFGWQQYIKVQTQFLRFCWHDALERLLSQRLHADGMHAGYFEDRP